MHIYREIYNKELAYTSMEADGPQARDPGEPMVQVQCKGNLLEGFFIPADADLFVLFKHSADWMRPPTLWRTLCLLKVP